MTNKNLIDLEAMSVKQIDKLVKKAKKIMQSPADYRHACDGKILATLFYEPSTRTQMSFQTAMLKLAEARNCDVIDMRFYDSDTTYAGVSTGGLIGALFGSSQIGISGVLVPRKDKSIAQEGVSK